MDWYILVFMMDCLCPKKEKNNNNEENKETTHPDYFDKRSIRKHNARLQTILEELKDYQDFDKYKQKFKLLFEFYNLEELLK